jgi:hypothetical protein
MLTASVDELEDVIDTNGVSISKVIFLVFASYAWYSIVNLSWSQTRLALLQLSTTYVEATCASLSEPQAVRHKNGSMAFPGESSTGDSTSEK